LCRQQEEASSASHIDKVHVSARAPLTNAHQDPIVEPARLDLIGQTIVGRIQVRGRILALLGEALVEERLGLDAADVVGINHPARATADKSEESLNRQGPLSVGAVAHRTDSLHQRVGSIGGASSSFHRPLAF
jgi:hypothetical protein